VNVDVANEIIEKLSISFTEFLLDDWRRRHYPFSSFHLN
jgi:hypothetical protein